MGYVNAHLLLAKIVWQVGNHDLRLAWYAILWWTALLAWLLGLSLAGLASLETFFALLCGKSLVGCGCERCNLAGYIGWASAVGGRLRLAICLALAVLYPSECVTYACLRCTYASATSSSAATTSSTAASSTLRVAALRLFLAALSSFSGWFGLTSKLNGDLAIQDGLAVQLVDGAVGLRRC